MQWLVIFLQSIPINRFQVWLEQRRVSESEQHYAMAFEDRDRWLASFDANGNYLHWSGYWASNTGMVFFNGRWVTE